MRYPPLPNPSSVQGGFTEGRGHSGVSTPQLKSRQSAYPHPTQLESGWHTSALGRPEGNPYPEQMSIKAGQNGHGFGRPSRSRMPNLNDLKETALWFPLQLSALLSFSSFVAPTRSLHNTTPAEHKTHTSVHRDQTWLQTLALGLKQALVCLNFLKLPCLIDFILLLM